MDYTSLTIHYEQRERIAKLNANTYQIAVKYTAISTFHDSITDDYWVSQAEISSPGYYWSVS